jgi:hypothetical protein
LGSNVSLNTLNTLNTLFSNTLGPFLHYLFRNFDVINALLIRTFTVLYRCYMFRQHILSQLHTMTKVYKYNTFCIAQGQGQGQSIWDRR